MDGRVHGIDVSHNNETVDWNAAAAAGIQFAFAKATQGTDFTDPMFSTNWPAMQAAGILRGAYHFLGFPGTDPTAWDANLQAQIDHFLSVLGPLQPGDLPPVLDLEDGDNKSGWKVLMASNPSGALAIVTKIVTYTTAQLGGVTPILYTGSFWSGPTIDSGLGDPTPTAMPFSTYPLWLAQYPQVHTPVPVPGPPGTTDFGEAASFAEYAATLDGHTPRHMPQVWGGAAAPNWTIWQFTSFGKIPAISAQYLDLDVFNGSFADLQNLCIPAPAAT